ncbi:MAG: hypothetical protein LIO90_06315 [Bacteroidales bacterium]|nr:hypothetical protein [Bacteroidales bacterium]
MQVIGNSMSYLSTAIGLNAEVVAGSSPLFGLPRLYGSTFGGMEVRIDGKPFVAIAPIDAEITPATLVSRVESLCKHIDMAVILVLPNVDFRLRQQLVKNRINFIVPNKQTYLPSLAAFFSERGLKAAQPQSQIAPSAQLLLLYHLQKESLAGIPLNVIGEKLGYSPKTITLAVDELQSVGLCQLVAEQGKNHKTLRFDKHGIELWQQAKERLSSPVMKIVFVDADLPLDGATMSYDSALSRLTFITEPSVETIAIIKGCDLAKIALKQGGSSEYPGSKRVQIWKYNPLLLAHNGCVDPLSLALQYGDDDDSRVQEELNKLINKTLCKD